MGSQSDETRPEAALPSGEYGQDGNGQLAHLIAEARGLLTSATDFKVGVEWAISIEARYDLQALKPFLFEVLKIPRPPSLTLAVPSRQSEFLAGRLLTRAALQILGSSDTIVGIGDNRAPEWPAGYSGSISHSGGHCICVVTAEANTYVGVDLERIASGRSLEAILNLALNPVEREALANQDAFSEGVLATLIFSAKETLFKALYPSVHCYFDFDAAALVQVPELDTLVLALTRALHPTLPAGRTFLIHYALAKDHVRTWLVEKR